MDNSDAGMDSSSDNSDADAPAASAGPPNAPSMPPMPSFPGGINITGSTVNIGFAQQPGGGPRKKPGTKGPRGTKRPKAIEQAASEGSAGKPLMRKLERKRWKWVKQAVEQAAFEGRTLSENEKHDISNKATMEYIRNHLKEFQDLKRIFDPFDF